MKSVGKMPAEKNIKIVLNSGLEIVIPRYTINKVVLPSVIINRNFHRLVLTQNDLDNQLKKIKKRFKL